MSETKKRTKSTPISRMLDLRIKTVGKNAKQALSAFSKEAATSPVEAVRWCGPALVYCSTHDVLVQTRWHLKTPPQGMTERQCIEDEIRRLYKTLYLHAQGGRSTSLLSNAATEAQMHGYANAIDDLKFVLDQDEGGE